MEVGQKTYELTLDLPALFSKHMVSVVETGADIASDASSSSTSEEAGSNTETTK